MRYVVITYIVLFGGFLVWWVAAMTKQVIEMRAESKKTKAANCVDLKMDCPFCNRRMHRDEKILLNEFNTCVACDSEIEALPPVEGNNCRIGRWRSLYA